MWLLIGSLVVLMAVLLVVQARRREQEQSQALIQEVQQRARARAERRARELQDHPDMIFESERPVQWGAKEQAIVDCVMDGFDARID